MVRDKCTFLIPLCQLLPKYISPSRGFIPDLFAASSAEAASDTLRFGPRVQTSVYQKELKVLKQQKRKQVLVSTM